jgi:hypothetical protein
VAVCCESGDEVSGCCATELVVSSSGCNYKLTLKKLALF